MSRRCVVCGKESAKNANDSSSHYPKNKKEARIWQKSMGAFEIPVESILKGCSVCVEHIPQFMKLTQMRAACIKANCSKAATNSSETLAENSKLKGRPSLNVLLLSSGSMAANGGKDEGNCCLDEEICVHESNYKDCGGALANAEETEVTVLRTPLNDKDELKEVKKNNTECGDVEGMDNCTDVLVLGRGQSNCTIKPQCTPNSQQSPNTGCSPSNPHWPLPKSNCEQSQSELIQQQQKRISELEKQLGHQNNRYLTLQRKLNELYTEFGNMEQKDANKNSSLCPHHRQQQ